MGYLNADMSASLIREATHVTTGETGTGREARPLTPQERRAAGLPLHLLRHEAMVWPEGPLAPDWERPLWDLCQRAGLNGVQREIVRCRVEGEDWNEIRTGLKLTGKALAAHRERIRERLTPALNAANRAASRFLRHLIFCVLDQRTYDERPPGVSGVTADRSSDRFQGAPMLTANDVRLGQGLAAAIRLAEEGARPVRVPEPA